MLKAIKILQLMFLAALPGALSAAENALTLTPGHCSGYMPIILEYQAKSAEESKVSEYSGGLHLLQAQRDREDAKRHIDNRPLMKELHASQAASDFDSDYAYAADIANQQAAFLSAATQEQFQREPEIFEDVGADIRYMEELCESMMADAVKIGNNRALGAFFDSVTNDD